MSKKNIEWLMWENGYYEGEKDGRKEMLQEIGNKIRRFGDKLMLSKNKTEIIKGFDNILGMNSDIEALRRKTE